MKLSGRASANLFPVKSSFMVSQGELTLKELRDETQSKYQALLDESQVMLNRPDILPVFSRISPVLIPIDEATR